MSLPTASLPTLLLVLLTVATSTATLAQTIDRAGDRVRDGQDEGLGFKLGETDLYPSLRVDFSQNSNAFLEPDNVTSTSDVVISPELEWIADRRLLSLVGSYRGEYNVSSEDALNYADHVFGLNANAELTSRKRLSGLVSLEFGHEELGTRLTSGTVAQNDGIVLFSNFRARGEYRYGADGARGNLSAGLLVQSLGYNSRDDLTAGRGFSRFEPFARFSLRLGGDTRLLSELRFGSFRFGDSDRDRDDLSLLTGLRFAATGKSGGSLRFGVTQSQRNLANASDQTEFILQASLFWEPTSFSRFDLDARRELDNRGSSLVSTDELTAIENLITLRWNHSWSSRVTHEAVLQSNNLARGCPDLDRNTVLASLEFNVQIRRWLSVGLNGSNTMSEVPGCVNTINADPNLDYQRTRFGAHIRATL